MIKLKSILKEIFKENMVSSSDEYELDIETDELHIPGLIRPGQMLKIRAILPYEVEGGYNERGQFGSTDRAEQGEGASVEFDEAEISEIFIVDEGSEEEREIDIRFLLPQQRKEIENTVEDYVENNKNDIESKILDGWEG